MSKPYIISIPKPIIALGGLHIWIYTNIIKDYFYEEPEAWHSYTAKTIAEDIGLSTPKGVKMVTAALKELCNLDFIQCERDGNLYTIYLNVIFEDSINVPYWCMRRILEYGGKKKYQLLQFYVSVVSTIDIKTGIGKCSQRKISELTKCAESTALKRLEYLDSLGVIQLNYYFVPNYKDLNDIPPVEISAAA